MNTFYLADTPKKKVDKIHRAICFAYSCISSIHSISITILSSNSRERQFFSSVLPKQPRFQPNIPSKRWYIARIFQIWYAPVAN